MKSFNVLILFVACVSSVTAFTYPSSAPRKTFEKAHRAQAPTAFTEALANASKSSNSAQSNHAAALAAFTAAMAPLAANAQDVDEGAVIGYGAGLVACVVSLALGFAVGYGTLVEP
mmetsp:Transcript_12690/g.19124  ORF Transcript_12690/g.19124 Transcript_12690/m.19124 type:complete len:116 (-) Transcript_12690:333-680(-)|eukprot:CAMPEP_0196811542 /NCGR_PEP_ID=MMETSP1362-20130617/18512_1 /TAXON_ID=163516 /ORGANISM="Leptocylindrus danicus, Strain CCMP1856" /LENGTH=115 /DNA_ID=CAMNT_0042186865 /DNA_START=75 /DNA_END=422 /DNA_ORIENTATION=+